MRLGTNEQRRLEFGEFLCHHVAVERLVLGLLFELLFVCYSLFRSECLNIGRGCSHLGLLRLLCCRWFACVRVADLRGEGLAVHLFEDDVGVFADFATELAEGGF